MVWISDHYCTFPSGFKETSIRDFLLHFPTFLAGRSLALIVDPGVGQVRNLDDGEQVVAAKTGGRLPFFAILVQTGQGDVVPGGVVALILPDRGADAAQANFVGRPLFTGYPGKSSANCFSASWVTSFLFEVSWLKIGCSRKSRCQKSSPRPGNGPGLRPAGSWLAREELP